MTKFLSTEKWLVAATLLVLVSAIYAHTWIEYVHGWHDEENMHGVAVVPIVAFLLWMNWPRLRQVPVQGNMPAGLTVLGLALLVQVGGIWLGLNRAVGYTFIVAVAGLCFYFLGTEMTRALAFPLAFLFFMVPTPGGVIDTISSPLQTLSAHVSAMLGGLSGIQVHNEGVYLMGQDNHQQPFQLQVAVGCSGLHSLTAMCMLAALLAYFMLVPTPWKWGLFVLGIPLALIGNIARIYAVLLVTNAGGQTAGERFHDGPIDKLLPFTVAFLILFGLGRLLEWQQAHMNDPEKN